MVNIFLDDVRMPSYVGLKDGDCIVCRTFEQVIAVASKFKISFISFDHDLGEEKTGYDVAKTLCDMDMDSENGVFTENFYFNVHSANPVGAKNIQFYMGNYLKTKKSL